MRLEILRYPRLNSHLHIVRIVSIHDERWLSCIKKKYFLENILDIGVVKCVLYLKTLIVKSQSNLDAQFEINILF